MRIHCSGLELSEALTRVSKAIPIRKTIPILDGIKMKAEGNKVYFYATDNNFTIKKTINATVYTEGEIVVDGRIFCDLIRKLTDLELELELGVDNKLIITYPDGRTYINCFNINEYPPIKTINEENPIKIKQGVLKDLINKVIFCASTDEAVMEHIKGCLIEVENSEIKIIAIDNCRMAFAKTNKAVSAEVRKAVVSSKNLAEISRLLEKEDEYCDLYITDKKLFVDMGHTQIIASLVGTEFFNYTLMMQDNPTSEVVVNKKQIETSLERAAILSKIQQKDAVTFSIRENFIKMQTNCERGNITENIAASLKGKDIDIGLGSKYLLDCLKVINDEFVRICMTSPTQCAAVKPVDDDNYTYIVLPVGLDN